MLVARVAHHSDLLPTVPLFFLLHSNYSTVFDLFCANSQLFGETAIISGHSHTESVHHHATKQSGEANNNFKCLQLVLTKDVSEKGEDFLYPSAVSLKYATLFLVIQRCPSFLWWNRKTILSLDKARLKFMRIR